jgi:hypothetical protein
MIKPRMIETAGRKFCGIAIAKINMLVNIQTNPQQIKVILAMILLILIKVY